MFFVEGRHDHEAPAELAEETDRFTRFMVETVLAVATRHDGR
ncbi:hypothetical protein [Kocuria sp. NPDC057446]